MISASSTTVDAVRDTVVRFLHDKPVAKHLWAHTERDHVTFWLLTECITPEEARELFRANFLIYETVPNARFDFLVVNPAMFDVPDFVFEPPYGAVEIPLH